jgi:hypothetical protein
LEDSAFRHYPEEDSTTSFKRASIGTNLIQVIKGLMFDAREWYSEDMAFEADIIVTDPESSDIAMVVEAKTSMHDLESSERQLKRYMAGMRCPVGLIVTPEQLRLYRNRYLSSSEDTIELVGAFDVHDVLNYKRSGDGRYDAFEFEGFVQAWLEGLGSEAGLQELPAELRRAAQWYIFPAVSQGVVRAGHPRSALSA